MKTIDEIKEVISRITYKPTWKIHVVSAVGGYMLSAVSDETDKLAWYIKDWYLSGWSTESEIVRTSYKAIINQEICISMKETTDALDNVFSGNINAAVAPEDICKNFKYKNWILRHEDRKDGLLYQIIFEEKDNDNPDKVEMQHCRKWFVSNADIKYTPYIIAEAVRTAEEHEINEQFKYNGQQVYNPHVEMNELAGFLSTHKYDSRPKAKMNA